MRTEKDKIVIWGYSYNGVMLYRKLLANSNFEILGFADNDCNKQGYYVDGKVVLSLDSLCHICEKQDVGVVIAVRAWHQVGKILDEKRIRIIGVYIDDEIKDYNPLKWDQVLNRERVDLYAGDICDALHLENENLFGLSINKSDQRHLFFDITQKYPIPDECIDSYQAEDVLEHIKYEGLVQVIDEIYRILKKGSNFRICLPDYNSIWLNSITMKTAEGEFLFDPTGGGVFNNKIGIDGGGHVWFPTYENVNNLLKKTKFKDYHFLCYRDSNAILHKKTIDYSLGHIIRVRDRSDSEIYSMVIDLKK